jgi:hypothetical protein
MTVKSFGRVSGMCFAILGGSLITLVAGCGATAPVRGALDPAAARAEHVNSAEVGTQRETLVIAFGSGGPLWALVPPAAKTAPSLTEGLPTPEAIGAARMSEREVFAAVRDAELGYTQSFAAVSPPAEVVTARCSDPTPLASQCESGALKDKVTNYRTASGENPNKAWTCEQIWNDTANPKWTALEVNALSECNQAVNQCVNRTLDACRKANIVREDAPAPGLVDVKAS